MGLLDAPPRLKLAGATDYDAAAAIADGQPIAWNASRGLFEPVHLPLRQVLHRYVPLGDSITIVGDTEPAGTRFDSYAMWLALFSYGRVQLIRNAGIGGNTSAQMLARFDTDVTPSNPTLVSVLAGTNDFTNGVSDTDFRANIKSLVGKIQAIGATPLLITSPPVNGLATADKQKITRNNAWMARYGAKAGILVVDSYTLWADPATAGNWQAALTVDNGTHPNGVAHRLLGRRLADALGVRQRGPAPAGLLSPFGSDPDNLLSNGLFTADSGGQANSWSPNWTPANGTYAPSIVIDPTIPGRMQRLSLTGAADKFQLRQQVTTGWSVGDVLELSGVATTSGAAGGGVHAVCVGGSKQASWQFTVAPVDRAVVAIEFTVPASTTRVDVEIKAQNIGSPATGYAQFGQLTLRNLTTGAMVTP